MQGFSHAHRESLLVGQLLFAESHSAARYHQTFSTFVLQLGHLTTAISY